MVVLGAGASRNVSYARRGGYLSPLDSDFFDVLRRLRNLEAHQQSARQWLLRQIEKLPLDRQLSLEKSFYTLHLRALMAAHLGGPRTASEGHVIKQFVLCIDAALRAAHGVSRCEYHRALIDKLGGADAIITFNYDLVAERALKEPAIEEVVPFGPWVYGLDSRPSTYNKPMLLKLHGSSNWRLASKKFVVRTQSWSDFDSTPGYRAAIGGTGTAFPIFLPFWEKRVEQEPWLYLWRLATGSLRRAKRLIVWGYSLPTTDVRTEQLFSLALSGNAIDLCVIDPSAATRTRWRALVPNARYWSYEGIADFLNDEPDW